MDIISSDRYDLNKHINEHFMGIGYWVKQQAEQF